MIPNDIILGIDFGKTIVAIPDNGVKYDFPNAINVIARCVKTYKKVYIISRVTPAQKIRLLKWVEDNDFCNRTGIPLENFNFCEEREEKAPIAHRLGITYMIDDRPEVMYFMGDKIKKILFNPDPNDIIKWNQIDAIKVTSWFEIEDILFKV